MGTHKEMERLQNEYEQYKNSKDDERRQYLQDLKDQNVALTESLQEYDDIVSSLKSRRKSIIQSNQLPNEYDEQQSIISDESQSIASIASKVSVSKNGELKLELTSIHNEIIQKNKKINELESEIADLKNKNEENEVDDEKMS